MQASSKHGCNIPRSFHGLSSASRISLLCPCPLVFFLVRIVISVECNGFSLLLFLLPRRLRFVHVVLVLLLMHDIDQQGYRHYCSAVSSMPHHNVTPSYTVRSFQIQDQSCCTDGARSICSRPYTYQYHTYHTYSQITQIIYMTLYIQTACPPDVACISTTDLSNFSCCIGFRT